MNVLTLRFRQAPDLAPCFGLGAARRPAWPKGGAISGTCRNLADFLGRTCEFLYRKDFVLKKFVLCAAAAALALALAGCGQQESEAPAADATRQEQQAPEAPAAEATAPGPVTFTDDAGNEVTVDNPQRVVACMGSFANAWELAGGTLVGVSDDALQAARLDHPKS